MRALDWARILVGPVEHWPQSLKTAVRIVLGSRYPMFVWWGRELTKFYNDAYIPVLGKRHPQALAQPASLVWAEIWCILGPQAETLLNEGRVSWDKELLLIMERNGYSEETYFTYSYSPVVDAHGGAGGVFCACREDTGRVLGRRRLRTLRELAASTAQAKNAEEACQLAARSMGENPHDMPFALLCLLDAGGAWARLVGTAGLDAGAPSAPQRIDIMQENNAGWPLHRVMTSGKTALVKDLPDRFGVLPGGPWPDPSQRAMVLPLAQAGQERLAGFLIAGLSPRLAFDDDYRGFLGLLTGQVATAISNARAYEAECQRAEALAELDQAKTVFFSNVSHEFRTPLTLLLGPVENMLGEAESTLAPRDREQLVVVHRAALRLQKLVNTLLDFSRLEAGRVQASYEPTDLAAHTAELASVFRSAVEKAGLTLTADCPSLPELVYVDREMREKIVLNLLSNAFKHTFEGGINVTLRWCGDHAELVVVDSGVGIPEAELPRLFEGFHRVKGAKSRTHEGTGIGLV